MSSVSANHWLLVDNNQRVSFASQVFQTYHSWVTHVFDPLPSEGKLCEFAKRVSIVVAPLIYPTLMLGKAIDGLYRSLMGWYVGSLLEEAARRFCEPFVLNYGNGPYELVVLITMRCGGTACSDSGTVLYAELLTLHSNQSANGQITFFREEIMRRQRAIQESLQQAVFHIGQELEMDWVGFLKTENGSRYRQLRGSIHRSCILLSPRGSGGFGGGIYNSLAEVRNAFQQCMRNLNATAPAGCQHFANVL